MKKKELNTMNFESPSCVEVQSRVDLKGIWKCGNGCF